MITSKKPALTDEKPKPVTEAAPTTTSEPKFKLERRKFPSWVVFMFCFTSVLLLFVSVLELPHHFNGTWYYAVFGIFKVVLWGIMTLIYVPETIARLKGKK